MKIRWTEKAASDLEAIYDFIAENNLTAALDTVTDIHEAISRLANFPQMGRKVDDQFPPGVRVLTRRPYLIFYHAVEDVIVLDSILHGNRRD